MHVSKLRGLRSHQLRQHAGALHPDLVHSRVSLHRHSHLHPSCAIRSAQNPSSNKQQPQPAPSSTPKPSKPPAKSEPEIRHIKVDLPPPVNSRVKKAVFVSSSVSLKQCPPEKHAEFAVIGRSNVGKSSLINMLTETDGLAKVSKEPGMTKTINHFLINDSWYLVDLPGYGFAKSSKGLRIQWLDFTQQYFIERDALVSVLLLVDSSVPPQLVDLECADWLAAHEVPFAIVFTKTDAKKKDVKSNAANIKQFKLEMLKEWEAVPPCFETSSKTGAGKSEVLGYISGLKQLHEASN